MLGHPGRAMRGIARRPSRLGAGWGRTRCKVGKGEGFSRRSHPLPPSVYTPEGLTYGHELATGGAEVRRPR